MTRRHRVGTTAWLAGVAALVVGVTLAACGLPTRTPAETPKPAPTGAAIDIHRITQLDFGRIARFASCVEPACPAITPKTMAGAPSPAVTAPAPIAAAQPALAPATELTPAIAAAPATAPQRVVLHFGTDSAVLTTSHKSTLNHALADLRKTDRLVIVGRTDNLGSEGRNQSLALARSLAIRDHLLDLAPDLPARIEIDARGRCCYAAPNESPDGRARNRRVELVYTLPTKAKP